MQALTKLSQELPALPSVVRMTGDELTNSWSMCTHMAPPSKGSLRRGGSKAKSRKRHLLGSHHSHTCEAFSSETGTRKWSQKYGRPLTTVNYVNNVMLSCGLGT